MKVDGHCHCGLITYEAEVDPERVEICHCTDCQTLSGSAFRTVVPVIEGRFAISSGQPRTYVKTAESGNRRAQLFCPDCGTPICSTDAGGGASVYLRVGTVRQRDALVPKKQYWFRSAQHWIADIAALPKVQTQ